mmetsp:Transcript_10394/g.23793  ORF Transcript_10394/g.23793 Transcript_10394/m.23793 type:complete len:256 (-) Transcript_10394:1038-1805(-)
MPIEHPRMLAHVQQLLRIDLAVVVGVVLVHLVQLAAEHVEGMQQRHRTEHGRAEGEHVPPVRVGGDLRCHQVAHRLGDMGRRRHLIRRRLQFEGDGDESLQEAGDAQHARLGARVVRRPAPLEDSRELVGAHLVDLAVLRKHEPPVEREKKGRRLECLLFEREGVVGEDIKERGEQLLERVSHRLRRVWLSHGQPRVREHVLRQHLKLHLRPYRLPCKTQAVLVLFERVRRPVLLLLIILRLVLLLFLLHLRGRL